MLILRATRKLLRLTDPPTAPDGDRGTTLLGPWYATVMFWQPRVVLLVNEATLLRVLLPLALAACLTKRQQAALGSPSIRRPTSVSA
ncbi:hypothetical protein K7G98_32330 [Saccharothrix sp. MB29]|nr:hypothetical protein [Saccharothrix sp. MB29]